MICLFNSEMSIVCTYTLQRNLKQLMCLRKAVGSCLNSCCLMSSAIRKSNANVFSNHRKMFVNALFLSENAYKSQDPMEFSNLIVDSDTEKKVRLVLMEFMFLRQTSDVLPETLTEENMAHLITLASTTKRKKYICRYLSKKHVRHLANERKELKRISEQASKQTFYPETEDHIKYGLGHNSLHFRVRESAVRTFYAHRLAQASIFGQKLVFDCDFEDFMSDHERMNTAVTLQHAYGLNSIHRNPFDLYFCNLKLQDSKKSLWDNLNKVIPSLQHPNNMITISEKSYTDVFPDKSKLIYLSPDAPQILNSFDEDAVYIIGALVDLGPKVPRTMAKAKKEGIRCLKLPLDRYLHFKPGASKSLTLNQVIQILLDLRSSGNWLQALKHVPKRAVLTTINTSLLKTE